MISWNGILWWNPLILLELKICNVVKPGGLAFCQVKETNHAPFFPQVRLRWLTMTCFNAISGKQRSRTTYYTICTAQSPVAERPSTLHSKINERSPSPFAGLQHYADLPPEFKSITIATLRCAMINRSILLLVVVILLMLAAHNTTPGPEPIHPLVVAIIIPDNMIPPFWVCRAVVSLRRSSFYAIYYGALLWSCFSPPAPC